jgi:hypothetical protein
LIKLNISQNIIFNKNDEIQTLSNFIISIKYLI